MGGEVGEKAGAGAEKEKREKGIHEMALILDNVEAQAKQKAQQHALVSARMGDPRAQAAAQALAQVAAQASEDRAEEDAAEGLTLRAESAQQKRRELRRLERGPGAGRKGMPRA